MEKNIERLQKMIDESADIVFLGGAGVSTASGIPDFRSAGGLYNAQYPYSPETILSSDFFYAHTQAFYDFYRAKMLYLNAKPNKAHAALAALERGGKLKAVVTQNIDSLHQAAGSRNVLELHGSVYENKCVRCGRTYGIDVIDSGGVPKCACGGVIKRKWSYTAKAWTATRSAAPKAYFRSGHADRRRHVSQRLSGGRARRLLRPQPRQACASEQIVDALRCARRPRHP